MGVLFILFKKLGTKGMQFRDRIFSFFLLSIHIPSTCSIKMIFFIRALHAYCRQMRKYRIAVEETYPKSCHVEMTSLVYSSVLIGALTHQFLSTLPRDAVYLGSVYKIYCY